LPEEFHILANAVSVQLQRIQQQLGRDQAVLPWKTLAEALDHLASDYQLVVKNKMDNTAQIGMQFSRAAELELFARQTRAQAIRIQFHPGDSLTLWIIILPAGPAGQRHVKQAMSAWAVNLVRIVPPC
jgi:hypothetical protein